MEAFGGLYTPRYSYLESGKLNSIACRRFDGLMVIGANPGDAIRYCHDGFILTGLVFRQSYFSGKEWKDNIENAYFPLINFGFMLETYRFLYLDRNWFYHTVLNFCHWEAWGADSIEQNKRLYRDYIDAIAILSENLVKKSGYSFLKLKYLYYESLAYKRQLEVQIKMIAFAGLWKLAPGRARSRLAFWLAIISLFVITCRFFPYFRGIRGGKWPS